MTISFQIRPVDKSDYEQWLPLWAGYNAFYGRQGRTALDNEITLTTWSRFLNQHEPVNAFVAQSNGRLVGLVHYIYHRSTTRMNDVCYLQDLYVSENLRGNGIGRKLIERVYEVAKNNACSRVYWQTQVSNSDGRALYDKLAQHLGFIVYSYEI